MPPAGVSSSSLSSGATPLEPKWRTFRDCFSQVRRILFMYPRFTLDSDELSRHECTCYRLVSPLDVDIFESSKKRLGRLSVIHAAFGDKFINFFQSD